MATDEQKAPEMEYRTLGGTGLVVSVLGFGMMTLQSPEHAKDLIQTCRKHGCNFFDNAEFYGNPRGAMEERFGAALKMCQAEEPDKWRRSDLVITTKLFWNGGSGLWAIQGGNFGVNEIGLSRKHLMEGMDGSLKRLQLDYVDIIYAHRPDPLTPMEEIVRGFTDIVRAGKAFYWGTSQWNERQITEAYWIARYYNLIPPVVEQVGYNMLTREPMEKGYLPLFEAPYKLGTTIYSPLASGLLTGKYNNGIPDDSRAKHEDFKPWTQGFEKRVQDALPTLQKLAPIAEKLGTKLATLAVAWTIKNPNVSVSILGGTKVAQLDQNFDALALVPKLTDEVMKEINEALGNEPSPLFGWGRQLKQTI